MRPIPLPVMISEVVFVLAQGADADRGLLGFLALTIDGALRLDGLALRRTTDGELTVSYPTRVDRRGLRHALVRPVDDEVRRAIQSEVLHELELQGISFASWAPRDERCELPCALAGELGSEAEADHEQVEAFLELGAGHTAQRTAGDGP